jgi:hypothetical protein
MAHLGSSTANFSSSFFCAPLKQFGQSFVGHFPIGSPEWENLQFSL